MAVHGPPDDASGPVLGPANAVTQEMGVKGIGDVGSLSVPPGLWDLWADRLSCLRGLRPPHSHIPLVPTCRRCFKLCVSRDLLPTLMTHPMLEFLLNTRVLKNVPLYLTCKHLMARVRRKHGVSKLPSLERLSYLLHSLGSGAYATKVDIRNCYWSVLLPETLQQAVWHQAPGLVQHLMPPFCSMLIKWRSLSSSIWMTSCVSLMTGPDF